MERNFAPGYGGGRGGGEASGPLCFPFLYGHETVHSFLKIMNRKVIVQNPVIHLRWSHFRESLLASEVNSESCQTSIMELFAKIVKKGKPFTLFTKSSILDI